MQFCENYLQKKTFLWLSKMPSPLGQASPACQWIRRSSWRWWVLAGSFPDSRGQVQLSGGGQTREHHLPKGGRSLESCCGWSPEFFPPSELWPAVTRGSASWVKHTTVNGQTRLQQSYCKPYLRKPLLVDVIHHNNLMVVTRWRSSRAEKFIRLKSVTKKQQRYTCLWNIGGTQYLRLRERGRMAAALRHSSPEMLSVQKCLERKCSSSGVGWKGSWCSFSCDEQDDWKWNKYTFNMKRKKKVDEVFLWVVLKECVVNTELLRLIAFMKINAFHLWFMFNLVW